MMLSILHIDPHLVAVDKPSGLLVHRSELATDRVTCMSLLRDQLGELVYPIHRLDRGASGVLLFARDPETARALAELFAGRDVSKRYFAVVRGVMPEEIEIDYPLAEQSKSTRAPGDPRRVEKSRAAVEARTLVRRLWDVELPYAVGRYQTARYSLAIAEPYTGRLHQIRRHLAHIRHPIIGDKVHGDGQHNRFFRDHFGIDRLLLHAQRLELTHPTTSERLVIESPVAMEMEKVIRRVKGEG